MEKSNYFIRALNPSICRTRLKSFNIWLLMCHWIWLILGVVLLSKGALSTRWWNRHGHKNRLVLTLERKSYLVQCSWISRMHHLSDLTYMKNKVRDLPNIPCTPYELFSNKKNYWVRNLYLPPMIYIRHYNRKSCRIARHFKISSRSPQCISWATPGHARCPKGLLCLSYWTCRNPGCSTFIFQHLDWKQRVCSTYRYYLHRIESHSKVGSLLQGESQKCNLSQFNS